MGRWVGGREREHVRACVLTCVCTFVRACNTKNDTSSNCMSLV